MDKNKKVEMLIFWAIFAGVFWALGIKVAPEFLALAVVGSFAVINSVVLLCTKKP